MLTRDWLVNARGNLTQEEVAQQSGITRQFYGMIESGERTPSVKVAKKIAAVLGFDWTLFFCRKRQRIVAQIHP
jgi:Predicted transcriptional regulators